MGFTYHVSLNLTNKTCMVVGGGNVAQRKINTLLEAGASVWIISPQISQKVQELVTAQKVNWIETELNFELLKKCFLVIAATNNRATNHEIASFCHNNDILVNVVDSLEESSFIVNSSFKQGDLTIAVSTNGKSPALAYKIKRDLEKIYGPEYALFIEILAEAREIAKEKIQDEKSRSKFFREIVRMDIIELIQKGNIKEAKERVKTCLLSY
ncbi:MAG: precorrin-2 dehydrogenase/sirohydrochlorin ferrochelatase family protein [Peptococcales bacterium]